MVIWPEAPKLEGITMLLPRRQLTATCPCTAPELGTWALSCCTADQVKPTFREKCPSRRFRTPPPAQCTMNARRMMATMTTTNQKKSTTIPGMAYPATVLALAMASSYPAPPDLSASRHRLLAAKLCVDRSAPGQVMP